MEEWHMDVPFTNRGMEERYMDVPFTDRRIEWHALSKKCNAEVAQ
jgi:hypothetical protein